MDSGPICALCTRNWDERLGYCAYCDSINDEDQMSKKKKGKKHPQAATVSPRSDTPVYDQLTLDFGFAPDAAIDWRNHPATAGLLEDNFS